MSTPDLAADVRAGKRAAIARAITLVESRRADHRAHAQQLLQELLPHTGNAKRVGITAMSHHAIDNALAEVVDVMTKEGDLDLLRAVRRANEEGSLSNTTYTNKKAQCASPDFNVVAATTWWFAGNDMAHAPVDVLLIDEAGQLALADALAAARSARNLVLLGDPLQLPQVSQASHPGGGGNKACLTDEQRARKTLVAQWNRFSPTSKARCTSMVTDMIGDQSYVELLTCLQMSRDVLTLPKQ